MADTKFTVSQRADQSGANLLDQRPALKIVQIHFHQPYYKGKTPRLFPHPSNTDAIRWLEKELFPKGDADKDGGSDALHFVCSPVKPHAEKAGLWVSVVNATEVPAGLYILEVPFLRKVPGGKRRENILPDGPDPGETYRRRSRRGSLWPGFPDRTRGLRMVPRGWGEPGGVAVQPLRVPVRGEHRSPPCGGHEEGRGGGEPESGFKTFLGVADTLKEGAAGLIGLVSSISVGTRPSRASIPTWTGRGRGRSSPFGRNPAWENRR